MSANKKIGFDILENSDMDTIEIIGTDKMNIDKNARDRMLKNSMREYEVKKKELGITQTSPSESSETAESVTGVEAYERRKLPHIIYIALCSAAAITLTVVSITMLKHQKLITPDIQNPITEITSSAATTAVTDTSVTIAPNNSVVTSKVTKTQITTTTTIRNTTTVEASTTVTVTETTGEQKPSDIAGSASYPNPHTDRTDITQEELEAAAVRAVKELKRDNAEFPALNPQMEFTFSYAFYDVNSDSVPELFISKNYILRSQYMYVYDGKDYVKAHFNGHDIYGNEKVHEATLENIDVFTTKKIIGMLGHQAGAQSFILYMDSDNTITPLHEYTYYRYYENGRLAEENLSGDDLTQFKYFCDEYQSYELVELNWIDYTDINYEE